MRHVLRAGALGRPRGMGWGGRQEGGSGWGKHLNPWLIHVNVMNGNVMNVMSWQKPLQYCKVISLQLIKTKKQKKEIKKKTIETFSQINLDYHLLVATMIYVFPQHF